MLTRISNTPRDYAWGSTTLLAALEGREPTGAPEAEIWFGDHPGSPSVVHDGTGRTLDEWMTESGTPARLPYLLKLLAAGAPLSIQAHPSKAQAEAGFAREEEQGVARDAAHRSFRDDNHKPELIVAISDRFEALAGLRDLDATRRLVGSLGDAPGPRALAVRLAGNDAAAALRDTIGWLLGDESDSEVSDIIAAAVAASEAVDATGSPATEFTAELGLARRLAEAYPDDPGVIVALLMNLVSLRHGEAVFIPAGVLHAYVDGLGVELMAASDNVLRGGLTAKHIDVDELLGLLDAKPTDPPLLRPTAIGAGVQVFDAGVADFALVRAMPEEEPSVTLRGVSIVLATAGAVRVDGASGASLDLAPGQAAIATADESPLLLHGSGEAFVAMPGVE